MDWIIEQLKDMKPFERILTATYRKGIGLNNDWIYGADLFIWKDEENNIWHQFRNDEPTQDFHSEFLKFKHDEFEASVLLSGSIY